MSIPLYDEVNENRKLLTVKYPLKDDNSDWTFVIVDKKNVKKVSEDIKSGNIKDMKTILYNTKKLIQEKRNEVKKN